MTPIRPTASPQVPAGQVQTPQDRDAGKLAAQRAFFAALGKAGPAASPAPVETAQAAPATPTVQTAAPADAPRKILRPGSLIDIRV
ncbi:MAG: hypothetical protein GC203_08395 [Phenylobacterium sp.]|uniref:hypothetical protein n=1 Tax=Phenylobacterium sp. TaxID=1871053 RepID=UPI0025D27758|nr:hypothetical protein [Phenylobacterium sp.]MBI1197869.1 hypothetical protein [Phenylobacterium sp.]